jgi:hypothetical protein
MATYWKKDAYLPTDRDPISREILPHAIPPGIYCEDEAAFRALQRGARTRSRPILATAGGGWELYGDRVFVATPAQAEFFRAVAAPAPPEPEPDTSLEEVVAKINSIVGVQPTGLTVPVPAAAPPPRPKPKGPSRAMRPAAASEARRRA